MALATVPGAPRIADPCVVTCASNITVSNDPNQCGAVVNYPPPTTTGDCGTVTCSPASGSFFPVGTTTVTCTPSVGPSCTFTITVNDTQPPSVTCSHNITAVPPVQGGPNAVVTFTSTASDNCPGVTIACVPPSGSTFPVGVTIVTCTATDASGNTATCSFTVTVFSILLQDDSTAATKLLWNASTGAYRFYCGGTIYTGTGQVTHVGNIFTLTHNAVDRRVKGTVDIGVKKGNATIQSPPGQFRCSIIDRDTTNNIPPP